jgi:hypothetical protein
MSRSRRVRLSSRSATTGAALLLLLSSCNGSPESPTKPPTNSSDKSYFLLLTPPASCPELLQVLDTGRVEIPVTLALVGSRLQGAAVKNSAGTVLTIDLSLEANAAQGTVVGSYTTGQRTFQIDDGVLGGAPAAVVGTLDSGGNVQGNLSGRIRLSSPVPLTQCVSPVHRFELHPGTRID